MFSLWTCLSLIYGLQNSVSSDQVVSLTCNQPINVKAGDCGTVKCFLKSALEGEEKCTILDHDWCNTNGTELCNRSSKKYICDSDLSYVSLTILNVQEEESFTAEIVSNCGMAKSHPIRVQLLPVLQDSVSSDEVVSLTCNQTINVTAGDSGTVKCFLKSALEGEEKCTILDHDWRNTNGTELCNRSSKKYICDSDLSYVSLTILNVQEEESFTAEIVSNCGMAKSHPIRVQLLPDPFKSVKEEKYEDGPAMQLYVRIFESAIVVAIFVFLCVTYRRREAT